MVNLWMQRVMIIWAESKLPLPLNWGFRWTFVLGSLLHNTIMSDSATPWTVARQASLSITNSWSSLRLTSTESVMPCSHLILCRPLLLLPPAPRTNSPSCSRWMCFQPSVCHLTRASSIVSKCWWKLLLQGDVPQITLQSSEKKGQGGAGQRELEIPLELLFILQAFCRENLARVHFIMFEHRSFWNLPFVLEKCCLWLSDLMLCSPCSYNLSHFVRSHP